MAGLPVHVVSTISGPPTKKSEDRTQRVLPQPQDRHYNSWLRRKSNPNYRVCYLFSSNVTYTPRVLKTHVADAYNVRNRLWTSNTMAGLPVYVVNTISGPPTKTSEDWRQRILTQPQDRHYNSWLRRESNPNYRVGSQGLYRPRHIDGQVYYLKF